MTLSEIEADYEWMDSLARIRFYALRSFAHSLSLPPAGWERWPQARWQQYRSETRAQLEPIVRQAAEIFVRNTRPRRATRRT